MLLFPLLDLRKARFEPPLHALLGGHIVLPAQQGIGQALHIGELFLRIMGVLVALSIIQLRHQVRRRIADHQRHRLGQLPQRVLLRLFIGDIERI